MPAIRHPGNTLVEYGVVGAILALAGLMAAVLFGNNLNEWINDLGGNVNRNIQASEMIRSRRNNSGGPGSNPVVPAPPGTGVITGNTVCYERVCLNIPDIPAGTVSSSGTNGGELTHALADVIRQIGEQLANDPEADPALAQLIFNLADEGHELGDYQMGLLDSHPQPQQTAESLRDEVKLRVLELQGSKKDEFVQAETALMDYLNAHPQALSPALRNIIRFESGQIKDIVDGYDSRDVAVTSSRLDSDGKSVSVPNNAQLTHQSANTICATGGQGCMRSN